MPRPPDIRVGLQLRMTLALIKSDSNEIQQGAGTDGGAALHLTQCPSGTPSRDDLSRTAKYLQLNSVFAGAVNT